jgi:hypothetical protein
MLSTRAQKRGYAFTWIRQREQGRLAAPTYLRSAAIPWGWILRVAPLIPVVTVTAPAWRALPLAPVVIPVSPVIPVPVVPVPVPAAAMVPAAAPAALTVPFTVPVPAAASLWVPAAAALSCCYLPAARPVAFRQRPTSQTIIPMLDDLCIRLPDLLPAQVLLACQVVLRSTSGSSSTTAAAATYVERRLLLAHQVCGNQQMCKSHGPW